RGEGRRAQLELRPAFNFRRYEDPVDQLPNEPYEFRSCTGRYEISGPDSSLPPLRMRMCDCDCPFVIDPRKIHELVYRSELERGYDYEGELWSPGAFQIDLQHNERATLVGSTENWEIINVLTPASARTAERDRRERLLNQAIP